jgi:hypothetical protein
VTGPDLKIQTQYSLGISLSFRTTETLRLGFALVAEMINDATAADAEMSD